MNVYLSRKAAISALFNYLRDRRAAGQPVGDDVKAIVKRYVARHPDRSASRGFVVHVLHPDGTVTL